MSFRVPRWHGLALLGLAAVIFCTRLYSYDEPPDWDVCTYAIIGHELNCGAKLYADIWDIKPPAVYVCYAAVEKLTGYGLREIFVIGVGLAVITMIALYVAGGAVGSAGGLFAATLFTVVGGNLQMDANRPNTESFINACLAWALALLLTREPRETRRWIGTVLLIALASLFKQVAVLPGLLLIFAAAGSWRQRLGRVAVAALIVVGVWLIVWAYFAVTGRASLAWITFVTAPRYYGGSVWTNIAAAFHNSRLTPSELSVLYPSAALTAIAVVWPIKNQLRGFLLALLIGTYAAIIWPGHYFLHYYQLLIVPLTIGGSWGAISLLRLPALQSGRLGVGRVAVAAVIVGTTWMQVWMYCLPAEKWAEVNYSTFYNWYPPVARDLDQRLPPGETFFDWSNTASLYFFAHRRPPTPVLWAEHLIGGPMAVRLTQQSLSRLIAHPPRYVTIYHTSDLNSAEPIAQWIAAHYEPVHDPVSRFPLVLLQRVR